MKATSEVFGMSNDVLPDSYVDRGQLDGDLARLLNRRVHIAVRGPSKCGKSWLRQRVISNGLVVQCRIGHKSNDIYLSALSALGISIPVEETTRSTEKSSVGVEGSVGIELVGKVGMHANLDEVSERTSRHSLIGKGESNLEFIAKKIIASGRRLIVEDVHYLSLEQREIFAYDMKTLWDYGCFVMVIGIWGDANMFVRLNPELSGRIEELSIEWGPDDLRRIIEKGSSALNVTFSREIQNKAIVDAFGNAGLLQRLVLSTLDQAKVFEQQAAIVQVNNSESYQAAAMLVADQLNGVYQKFSERVATGIRTRSDATGIYAHAMAAIVSAEDELHRRGIPVDYIFSVAHKRQPRIQKSNLKSILAKIDGLQVDRDGRGLVVTYDPEKECVLNVDRQLLFYRKYQTVAWPWEQLISEVGGNPNDALS